MNPDAIAKIRMIKASLQCFVLGLLGLLPLIGFPFAAAALAMSDRVRRGQRRFWNPARGYWICGVICASFGILLWLAVFALGIANSTNGFRSSDEILGLTYLVGGVVCWFVIVISLFYIVSSRSKM